MVVDGGGSDRFGPFGDLLADGCLAKGVVGAVFDCTIRDSADIAALGFQVFCRGFHPEATAKTARGETNCPVAICGVVVHPGDIVVGDDDEVVVVKQVENSEMKLRFKIPPPKQPEVASNGKDAGECEQDSEDEEEERLVVDMDC